MNKLLQNQLPGDFLVQKQRDELIFLGLNDFWVWSFQLYSSLFEEEEMAEGWIGHQ